MPVFLGHMKKRRSCIGPGLALWLLASGVVCGAADSAMRAVLNADWLKQAEAWQARSTSALSPASIAGAMEQATRHFLERGRRLAADLRQAGVDTGAFESEFAAAESRLVTLVSDHSIPPAGAVDPASAGEVGAAVDRAREVYLNVRGTMRRLAFRNPRLDFKRLLFTKRFCQETYPDVCLNHMPWVSKPGGDLCILTLAGPEKEPKVEALLKGALGPGHVHGMDLSWDGRRIVFGYARSRTNQPPAGWLDRTQSYRLRRTEEPIHLYEIGVNGRKLRQITCGEWSDLDPTYAPNGDIVFVSERCGTSLQCNEYDKDETSCNLYVIHPDGSGLRRLSVSKDGDYLPHTLDDGTIAYTRWEYHERSWAFIQSLWTVRPDGTQADAIFKQHFVNPWALEDARSVPGTRNTRLACVAAGHHTLAAGPVVVVTPGLGLNDPRGISIVTPGVVPPEGGMDGVRVPQGGVHDRGGYYMHPWPLSEKTFLVSYTFGTGRSGLGSEVDPAGYALYLIDVFGTKELIYRDPSISCFTPMPLRARTRPPVLPDLTAASARYATCLVSSVSYGCDGIDPDRIRFLRVAEPVGWPYDNQRGGERYGEDHRYGGPAERRNLASWTPVRILGDVPVERDGSAKFVVPVDTAVYFQALDENRMELRRMRSFISFQPGEQRPCTGCHESRVVAPVPSKHAVSLAMNRDASHPMPPPWGDRAVSFLRDIQPVLDRQCVECHSGLKPGGGIDLGGGLTSFDAEVAGYGYNRAYETILDKRLVSISAVRAQDASITPPLAYGSLKSKLLTCLTNEAHREKVSMNADDRLRLAMWIDANAPYHDGFVNKRPAKPAYDLPGDKALAQSLAAVHQRRCGECHEVSDITRLDWIDLREPARSLFLTAPLAVEAGGGDRCGQAGYPDTADADYQAVRELVRVAVERAWENPRRDLVTLERPASKATRAELEPRSPTRHGGETARTNP